MAGTSTRMPVSSGAGPFTQVCDPSPGGEGRGPGETLLLTQGTSTGVSELPDMGYRVGEWAGADLYFWGKGPSSQQVYV